MVTHTLTEPMVMRKARLQALVDKHGAELAAQLLGVKLTTLRESINGPRCKISLVRIVKAERK